MIRVILEWLPSSKTAMISNSYFAWKKREFLFMWCWWWWSKRLIWDMPGSLYATRRRPISSLIDWCGWRMRSQAYPSLSDQSLSISLLLKNYVFVYVIICFICSVGVYILAFVFRHIYLRLYILGTKTIVYMCTKVHNTR